MIATAARNGRRLQKVDHVVNSCKRPVIVMTWPTYPLLGFSKLLLLVQIHFSVSYLMLTLTLKLSMLGRTSFLQQFLSSRLFTVLYFSVRSSRSRALRYGLPILHECQNYLGGGGGLGGSEKNIFYFSRLPPSIIPDARLQDSRDGKNQCF